MFAASFGQMKFVSEFFFVEVKAVTEAKAKAEV
jgi:hypothetical protein